MFEWSLQLDIFAGCKKGCFFITKKNQKSIHDSRYNQGVYIKRGFIIRLRKFSQIKSLLLYRNQLKKLLDQSSLGGLWGFHNIAANVDVRCHPKKMLYTQKFNTQHTVSYISTWYQIASRNRTWIYN